MLKIAIISDIHANLPAFEAVLEDIQKRNIDQLYCLGDLVDFAPWPNEVIDLVRQNRIPTLMGNHDERIAFDLPVIPLQKHSFAETEARIAAIDYTHQTIRPENKAYLADLPRECTLTFVFADRTVTVLLVHASPRAIDEYLYEAHDQQDVLAMMAEKQADVLIMGHTHLAYIRTLNDLNGAQAGFSSKIVINCGSVGRSKENVPAATYLLLTVSETQRAFNADSLRYELIYVPYPIEQTIEGIEESPIPDFYAHFLQKTLVNSPIDPLTV